MKKELKNQLDNYINSLKKGSDAGIILDVKFQTTVILMRVLEKIIVEQNMNPYPLLLKTLKDLTNYINQTEILKEDISLKYKQNILMEHNKKTAMLFENAWTVYTPETYDHSVGLIEKRFAANGFNKQFFKGKICFDGGCGTGRLSIAMAKLGAKKVIAADFGDKSLEYFKKVIKRYKFKNIEIKKIDVTDLSYFKTNTFDFTASYGVLHHTKSPIKGIKEHLRVTNKNGILWLYLYGAGGFYWDVYDAVKKVVTKWDMNTVKQKLIQTGIREGLIYTYLDNILAPRKYYYTSEIIKLLSKTSDIKWKYAKGVSFIDDPVMSVNTKYGKDILGPEGEVRIIITKQ